MRGVRRLGIMFICTVAAGTLGVAASDPATYWPMAVGMQWEYLSRQGEIQTVAVVEHQHVAGEDVAVIEYRQSTTPLFSRTHYVVRDEQVLLVAQEAMRAGFPPRLKQREPPILMWPRDAAIGHCWRAPAGPGTSDDVCIERQERVSVPAGTYETLVVVHTDAAGATLTEWFAPGVGLVKSMYTPPPAEQEPPAILELAHFSPGPGSP